MIKVVSQLHLLLAILFIGLSSTAIAQKNPVSLEDACEMIRHSTKGKVLSAKTMGKIGAQSHRIQVLTPSGRVRIYNVPVQDQKTPKKYNDSSTNSQTDAGRENTYRNSRQQRNYQHQNSNRRSSSNDNRNNINTYRNTQSFDNNNNNRLNNNRQRSTREDNQQRYNRNRTKSNNKRKQQTSTSSKGDSQEQ